MKRINEIFHSPWVLIAGVIHWLSTFLTEAQVLTAAPWENWFNYILCKLLLLLALPLFWRFVCRALRCRESRERRVALYALPYLAVLSLWLFAYHPMELSGDELNIFERAVRLDSFAYWFNYPTGFYWISCLMLLPHRMGPVIIKMLLQALVVGYCVARQEAVTKKKTALLLYLPFLLPFVLDQGISAHRLPTYGIVYLVFVAKLFYDHWEKKPLDKKTLLLLSLCCGLLGMWRTEGIYLLPLGAVLIACAYRLKPGKQLLKPLVIYLLAVAVVLLPQYKGYTVDSEVDMSLRTKPLCGYLLCNMFRNGLTEDMILQEREDIEGYLKLSTIREYNSLYGDSNYNNAAVMAGVEDADYAAQERFCSAVMKVVRKHPVIYAKSQLKAFLHTSFRHRLSFDFSLSALGNNINTLSLWVWIPCLLVALLWVFSLVKRRWLLFWLSSGGLANLGLVVALMPAAFEKYFYVDYLMGYFFLFVGLCFLLSRERRRGNG